VGSLLSGLAALVGPILLKEFLPRFLRWLMDKFFKEAEPLDPVEYARVKIDDVINRRDLKELGRINTIVAKANNIEPLTRKQLDNMLRLVDEED